jgi:hypothetical protein
VSAAALKLVPASTPAESHDSLHGLRLALDAIEHGGRRTTRRLARKALAEVAQVVATIGLHLPVGTVPQREYEPATFNPILEAIDRATGHCPRCDARVATWAVPTGRSAFVPCASHRAGGAL